MCDVFRQKSYKSFTKATSKENLQMIIATSTPVYMSANEIYQLPQDARSS